MKYRVYADGQSVVTFDGSALDAVPNAWAIEADGTLVFFGVDHGTVKRWRITPAADTSVDTLPAAAP